jgi:hypothetical protein
MYSLEPCAGEIARTVLRGGGCKTAPLPDYNRLLRAFVLIDLKIGRLTHRDIGQMQMYVNYYTREEREEWEAPAIGILLCAEKNDSVVRYTLPEGEQRIFASRYQLYLPSEEELAAELSWERELLSLHRRLEDESES